MHRFGVLQAGPAPVSEPAPERPWREAFAAAVAAQLELPWPEPAQAAKVGRRGLDAEWRRALYAWVRNHVQAVVAGADGISAPLPPATRPAWWRPYMSVLLEAVAQPEQPLAQPAEALAQPEEDPEGAAEPAQKKRAYHREPGEVRRWVKQYALLRTQQRWTHANIWFTELHANHHSSAYI